MSKTLDKKTKISYEEAVKLGLTKVCSKCGEEKTVDNFDRNKGCKYGVRNCCKQCMKKYREDNKDSIAEGKRRYYEEHKKEVLNKCKKYREEHKEEKAEYDKKYREEHKEEIKEYKKNYYEENKEEIAVKTKNYREDNKEKIAKRKKIYYEENKEGIVDYKKKYYKNNKEKISEKHKKYYEKNKEKILKRAKIYREGHKEEKAEYKRKYYLTLQGKETSKRGKQKRRALENNSFHATFVGEARNFCLEYFNYKCPYTGKDLTQIKTNDDHIVALSDKNGIGATAPWNMLVCDASINLIKSNKPILEFIETLPNSEEVYNNIRGYVVSQARIYIDIIPEDDITLKTFNITFEELLIER